MKGDLAAALHQAMMEGDPARITSEELVARMFEIAGTDPCFVKAKADEPLFVLRAQDELAPAAVHGWAERAQMHLPPHTMPLTGRANPQYSEPRVVSRRAKIAEARGWAEVMRTWGVDNGCKLPD